MWLAVAVVVVVAAAADWLLPPLQSSLSCDNNTNKKAKWQE